MTANEDFCRSDSAVHAISKSLKEGDIAASTKMLHECGQIRVDHDWDVDKAKDKMDSVRNPGEAMDVSGEIGAAENKVLSDFWKSIAADTQTSGSKGLFKLDIQDDGTDSVDGFHIKPNVNNSSDCK